MAELNGTDLEEAIIFEDNTAAAAWAQTDGRDHNRTKHIDIRYQLIVDHVKKGHIKVQMCPTAEMVADIMTKPLQPKLHYATTARMMGKTSQMSDHSEEELQASLRSKLKLDTDATNEDPELEEIENVDLVIENDLSRASTPVFYLGSSA